MSNGNGGTPPEHQQNWQSGEAPPQEATQAAPGLDPAVVAKIEEVRARVHETFGKVALTLMAVPRYRHLSIADLQPLVLEPLMHDRIAIAMPAKEEGKVGEAMAGVAIWASVSEEVDAKIREQIKAGTFPVRLKASEWASGKINWLLDVIAPTPRLATAVIANFKQVVKEGDLRIHPVVTRLVDREALEKMGATRMGEAAPQPAASEDAAPEGGNAAEAGGEAER